MQAALAKAAAERDATVSAAKAKIGDHKVRINKDWMSFVSAKFQGPTGSPSAGGVHLTVNIGNFGSAQVTASAPPY